MSNFKGHLLFSYPGSKWSLALKYAKLFPPHKTYVDVFGGTGVLLVRKAPSDVEILNDLDADVINVFRVIQGDQYPALVKLIKGTRNTRQQYDLCRAVLDNKDETPVRRAWSFIVCGYTGFNLHPKLTRTYANSMKGTSRLANCPKWLPEWKTRLKNVVIENEPWQQIIEKYDADDTFFALDPPYMPGVLRKACGGYYQHAFTTDDHIELLETIQHVKGKVFLCGYNHPAYLRRLWHWRQESFDKQKALTGKRSARKEQVWVNYDTEGIKVIDDHQWITEQYIALAGGKDCEEAEVLIDLLKEITLLAKGAFAPFASEGLTKRKDRSKWLSYTTNGSTFLDNRLWIGKQFIEAVGGFEVGQRMLATACSEVTS